MSFLKCGNWIAQRAEDVDAPKFCIFWFVLAILSENTQKSVGIFGCCCILSRWAQRPPALFPEQQLSVFSSAPYKHGSDYSH